MEYTYWGYIAKRDDGSWEQKRPRCKTPKPIDPSKLSKEFKTKIAMLDFMKDYEELPCGSSKIHYNRDCNALGLIAYFLCVEVSSTRESEAKERSVKEETDGVRILGLGAKVW